MINMRPHSSLGGCLWDFNLGNQLRDLNVDGETSVFATRTLGTMHLSVCIYWSMANVTLGRILYGDYSGLGLVDVPRVKTTWENCCAPNVSGGCYAIYRSRQRPGSQNGRWRCPWPRRLCTTTGCSWGFGTVIITKDKTSFVYRPFSRTDWTSENIERNHYCRLILPRSTVMKVFVVKGSKNWIIQSGCYMCNILVTIGIFPNCKT